jgi:ribosomal protein S12 methylthiotransferase
MGRTEWDAPEIDQEVFVRSSQPLKAGTFHTVTITDAVEYDLFASV